MRLRQLKRSEQGFALIAAIVLIVILAAMAGFVATMVSGQSAGQQLERMSGVADRAAQTGVEWGAYQVLRQSPGVCPFVPAVQPLSVPGTPVGMTVAVSCAPGAVPATYQITATAIFDAPASPAGPDYVERIKTAVFP
jgi:MSHA biogenesis protein MshP